MDARIMVMAGGTGGHVFPALAVAEELKARGAEIFWLGVPDSFEARVVPEHGIEMEWVSIKGLRGKGLLGWITLPFRLLRAMSQAGLVMLRREPALVLGMGGFVAGPGGLMARLGGIPLVIHEQNAIPGMTNQYLARIATRVLEAFPGSFQTGRRAEVTGNPVRSEIAAIDEPGIRFAERDGRLRLLVLGGSLGAQALNETVPQALALIPEDVRPEVRHQAGSSKLEDAQVSYRNAGVDAQVTSFISDMAEAYAWADLVICRAGALTVAELAAAGVGALLVPYPYAVDDHQTQNAAYLADKGAALLLPQNELTPEYLARQLEPMLEGRVLVRDMAEKSRALALPDATRRVADICEEIVR
ncbi:undecaprenyldiphospho-muramoylpentapeptide beta-N-acetylglucosaminyltransferase [Solemya velesiana gill symbiont]|uniref:UDP-N-acetylglucosamine--N-acetylmuramyl-(pentapeptide) pyrophosphoryl-undecaprenol N-acetylglucosamine transferase n=1 Tax=Solemya velesiana gill symbiont TaxID=1918948 RepID=A0A1T2KWQ7_9GAMM|nr:undecaprenyldiphospho-muramoylpentapeptide beta-N-acetylglucosaminyltransferase [Solemya velesiana gill symbiont]OOZ37289.1 undecaprenyldiphospho-muramoylpentapeptide beta-N-acetylglucosaminyltransferase [Solemya velesiana gill symbiont]